MTGEEHRKRDSLNELKFGWCTAIFMPKTIRLRAARIRRDRVKSRRDELVTGGE